MPDRRDLGLYCHHVPGGGGGGGVGLGVGSGGLTVGVGRYRVSIAGLTVGAGCVSIRLYGDRVFTCPHVQGHHVTPRTGTGLSRAPTYRAIT